MEIIFNLATPWTVACQVPLSMELSRKEYWSGLPFPPLGDLPDPGSLTWRAIPSPLSKLKRRLDTLESTQWAPRDPCRDLRGKWSPLLPLEARPDSPGESGMETRDLCLPLRQGFPRAAAPVEVFSRGTTRISGSLSCGAREVRSPCAWRG